MANSSVGGSDPVILATAGYDHTIRFWQAHSGICHRVAQHPDSQVNALEITPDRQYIAAAGYQHIKMYDLNSNNPNPVINCDGVSKNVTAVGFHEDGKWMYTGGEDGYTRIWDLRSRNLQCQRMFQAKAPINCVCLHPNQGELLMGDQNGTIYIWDLKTDHNEQLVPERDASIQHLHVDLDGSYLAAVNNKGTCFIWSLSGGVADGLSTLKLQHRLPAHKRYALKCRFSPDSTLLATTSADHTVKVWRTADLSLATTLTESTQRWVWDVAFSADSQYVVTASSDCMARLWSVQGEAKKAEICREYSGHQKAVTALAFCDGPA